MARFEGRALIADLIADDQQAVPYASTRFSIESHNAPNIKVGHDHAETELVRLAAMAGRDVTASQFFGNWENRTLDNVLLGVRQRMNALIVAAKLDSVVYDRLGIKINGTFGMPADLKVTPSVPWTDAANATPVNDFQTVKLVARVRYGRCTAAPA